MNVELSARLITILPWVLPPVLGAVIGYVTNAIAIRMLFRPLTEKRVLGIRLPFTPGIIPRQRFQLAESIGQMVSRELLTEEAVRRQLDSEHFQERLQGNVNSLLGDLVRTPLERLQRGNRELVFESVEGFLSDALYGFFSSRSFMHGVRTIMGRLMSSIGRRPIGEILQGRQVGGFLADRLLPLLGSVDSRAGIARAVTGWLKQREEGDERLGAVVPEELTGVLVELVSSFMPALFDSLFVWLSREDTRRELDGRGRRLLREVLEKLNVLQRFLISAGQFDRTLAERMPEIIDEAMESLRSYLYDPGTLDSLKGVLLRAADRWRDRPAAEAFSGIDPEKVVRGLDAALGRLQEAGTRERFASWIERLIDRLGNHSLAQLLNRVLRVSDQEAVEYLSNRVLVYLSRKETSQAIAAEVVSFSRRFIEEHGRESIAELLHVEESLQERFGVYLSARLIRIIDNRLPAFIESFDVRRMVVEKINDLDVAQVEALLLMVIQRHLRWINLFGGILGALIGFSQLLLRLFR